MDIIHNTTKVQAYEFLSQHNYTIIRALKKTLYGNIIEVKSDSKRLCAKISYMSSVENSIAMDDPLNEIKIHKDIKSHPNIVTYVDSFETDKFYILLMEFHPHGDICDYMMKNEYSFSTEEILCVMYQIINGVKHINNYGYACCDISLENIIIETIGSSNNPQDWKVRHIDIGDCVPLDSLTRTKLNKRGKTSYRPPEYQEQKESINYIEAQVFSLGCLMYILAASSNPFNKHNDPYYEHLMTGMWLSSRSLELAKKNSYKYTKIDIKLLRLIDACFKYPDVRLSFNELDLAINTKLESFNTSTIDPPIHETMD